MEKVNKFMKIYKRPLAKHHEYGVATVRCPDGIERRYSAYIAKKMSENHPGQYSITHIRPPKRPWLQR